MPARSVATDFKDRPELVGVVKRLGEEARHRVLGSGLLEIVGKRLHLVGPHADLVGAGAHARTRDRADDRAICLSRSSQELNARPISLIKSALAARRGRPFREAAGEPGLKRRARSVELRREHLQDVREPLENVHEPLHEPREIGLEDAAQAADEPLELAGVQERREDLLEDCCSDAVFLLVSVASVGIRPRSDWIPSAARSLKKSARPGAVAFFHSDWK